MSVFTIPASVIAEAKHKHRFHGFYAASDSGASYQIVAEVEGELIVEGYRHKNLGRLVKTGNVVSREGLVRVRIEFATDLGDAEGTLSFGDGERVGGHANYRLFEAQEG